MADGRAIRMAASVHVDAFQAGAFTLFHFEPDLSPMVYAQIDTRLGAVGVFLDAAKVAGALFPEIAR